MTINKEAMLDKMVGMFSPYDGDTFLKFLGAETIRGPDDRSTIGFTNHFPKKWLMEDFNFTSDEADWLISQVHGKQE